MSVFFFFFFEDLVSIKNEFSTCNKREGSKEMVGMKRTKPKFMVGSIHSKGCGRISSRKYYGIFFFADNLFRCERPTSTDHIVVRITHEMKKNDLGLDSHRSISTYAGLKLISLLPLLKCLLSHFRDCLAFIAPGFIWKRAEIIRFGLMPF